MRLASSASTPVKSDDRTAVRTEQIKIFIINQLRCHSAPPAWLISWVTGPGLADNGCLANVSIVI